MRNWDLDKIKEKISQPFEIKSEHIDFFRKKGFIKLKNVLSSDILKYYGEIITQKVIELNTLHIPMEKRNSYQKAFLQVTNIWCKDNHVKDFVFGKRLAKIAADLIGTSGVRMYHDQALYKEAGGGITPWHADQFYWPLSSSKSVTAWIPLQRTPLEMGPLSFAAESHNFEFGRDLPISDESEKQIEKALKEKNFDMVIEPFDLGEVSFHYGWTFHNAGINKTALPRRVMTVIYIDESMILAEPANSNQVNDMRHWCPGITIGEIIASELNPVLFSYKIEGQ